MKVAIKHVSPNPAGYELAGMALWGRVYVSVYDFAYVFGEAHEHDPGGEKAQHFWYFETPRGRVCVRDWHSSPRDRLSIVATDRRACLWVASLFRHLGLGARGNLC